MKREKIVAWLVLIIKTVIVLGLAWTCYVKSDSLWDAWVAFCAIMALLLALRLEYNLSLVANLLRDTGDIIKKLSNRV